METPERQPLVPAADVARLLSRHPGTVRADLREGRLPGVQIGRRWYMTGADLDALIASGRRPQLETRPA